jgi:outer membrane protein assembly factor BamB
MRRAALSVLLAVVAVGLSVDWAATAEITGGGALWTLDARSGRTLWTRAPEGRRLLHVTGAWKDELQLTEERCVEFEPLGTRRHTVDARTGRTRPSGRTVWPPVDPSRTGLAAQSVLVRPLGVSSGIAGVEIETGGRLWSLPDRYFVAGTRELVVTLPQSPEARPVVEAHDRRTGELRWALPAAATTWNGMVGVVASDSTTVVVADGDPGVPATIPTTFHVLDAATGRERTAFLAANPKYSFSEIRMDDRALLYVEDVTVVARSLTDGATVWSRSFDDVRAQTGALEVSLTGGAGDPLLVQLMNDHPRVVALDPTDGATTWQRSDATVAAAGPSTVVVRESFTKRLAGVDRQTGATRWRRTIPDAVTAEPSGFEIDVADGRVFVTKACDLG